MNTVSHETPAKRSPRVLRLEQFRLLAALLVVAIHSSLLSDVTPWGFLLPEGIARLAVPYFALMTGYFAGARALETGPEMVRRWSAQVLRTYLFLFPLYAPFFFYQIVLAAKVSRLWAVEQFFRCVFFNGFAFHLWYLPNVVLALSLAVALVRRARGVALPLALSVGVYVAASMLTSWGWLWPAGGG